jgi:hypothetical protein
MKWSTLARASSWRVTTQGTLWARARSISQGFGSRTISPALPSERSSTAASERRPLRAALARADAGIAANECHASGAAPAEWQRAGRLSEAERENIAERALRDIARPVLEGLLARSAGVQGTAVGAASMS